MLRVAKIDMLVFSTVQCYLVELLLIAACPALPLLNLLKYLQLWWRQINSHTKVPGPERVTPGELISSVETKMMMARLWSAVEWSQHPDQWSISTWRLFCFKLKQTELKQSERQITSKQLPDTLLCFKSSNLKFKKFMAAFWSLEPESIWGQEKTVIYGKH